GASGGCREGCGPAPRACGNDRPGALLAMSHRFTVPAPVEPFTTRPQFHPPRDPRRGVSMKTKMAMATALVASAALALTACSSGGGGNNGDPADATLNFFTDKAAWESSFDDMNDASEG